MSLCKFGRGEGGREEGTGSDVGGEQKENEGGERGSTQVGISSNLLSLVTGLVVALVLPGWPIAC